MSKLKEKSLFFLKDEDGGSVALVEFAFIFPLIATLLMGLIEFGFIIQEWRRLNDLVEAQVLYLSASSASRPSNAQQLYSSFGPISSTITSAVAEVNSRIRAGQATPSVTLGCGCPIGTGASSTITLSRNFDTSPPYCPPPSNTSCGVGSSWFAYAEVTATKQHEGFFTDTTWLPKMTARALVRIF